MKQLFFLLISVITGIQLMAQHEVPRDTSFTPWSAFVKERKTRPYITIAHPVKKQKVKIVSNLVYHKIQERTLTADVYYPKNIHKFKAAVLMIFGGGWRSGDKSHNEAIGIALANAGYVAVSADYRLSTEAVFPAAVYDLKAAVKWMKANAKLYGIDTSTIVVLGCSAGAQLASLIGTTNGNGMFEDGSGINGFTSSVQAVINIDGVLAFHHPESSEGKVAAQWLGGTYSEKPDVWLAASALTHTNKNTVPHLFINSSIPRFHAGRDDMRSKMDSLGTYSEVHTMPDSPHPFWFFHPWFNPMMDAIINFLKRQF